VPRHRKLRSAAERWHTYVDNCAYKARHFRRYSQRLNDIPESYVVSSFKFLQIVLGNRARDVTARMTSAGCIGKNVGGESLRIPLPERLSRNV